MDAAAAWAAGTRIAEAGFGPLEAVVERDLLEGRRNASSAMGRDRWDAQVYETWRESVPQDTAHKPGEPGDRVVAVFVLVDRGADGRWSVAGAKEYRCGAPWTYKLSASLLNDATGPRFLRLDTPINGGVALVRHGEDWFDLDQGFRRVLTVQTRWTDAGSWWSQMWNDVSDFRLIPGGGPEGQDRVVALAWGRFQERRREPDRIDGDEPMHQVRTRQGLVSWVMRDGVLVYDEAFSTLSEADFRRMGRVEFFEAGSFGNDPF